MKSWLISIALIVAMLTAAAVIGVGLSHMIHNHPYILLAAAVAIAVGFMAWSIKPSIDRWLER